MNIVGVITEHNPYHNGHLYHVEKARETCSADYVISVMSGHFLQRGEPALFNKWARAKMAVRGGVDLVIELPTAFSVRSASTFAYGSISVLNSTGVTTHLCFGSETGSIDNLWPAARLLYDEPPEFKVQLNAYLDQGLSYPAARERAVSSYFAQTSPKACPPDILATPNNILGIEYMKSLLALKSEIIPTTIKRQAAGYHDTSIRQGSSIASATSIREELRLSDGQTTESAENVVPPTTLSIIKEEIASGRGPVFIENYAKILFYLLRITPPEEIAALCDVTEGLENRIISSARTAGSVKDLMNMIKTKRYTWTRLQRILAYILLGFTSSRAQSFDNTGPRYLRVLGMSSRGRELLRIIKKEADIPVITLTSPYLRSNDPISEMLNFDVKATDIYTLLYPGTTITNQGLDCKIMPYVDGETAE